jgi:hypothetical protein
MIKCGYLIRIISIVELSLLTCMLSIVWPIEKSARIYDYTNIQGTASTVRQHQESELWQRSNNNNNNNDWIVQFDNPKEAS